MITPAWRSLLVRVWRDRDGLKIRFVAVDGRSRQPAFTVLTSVESAVEQFGAWLNSEDDQPAGDPQQAAEAPGQLRRTRNKDGGSAARDIPGS